MQSLFFTFYTPPLSPLYLPNPALRTHLFPRVSGRLLPLMCVMQRERYFLIQFQHTPPRPATSLNATTVAGVAGAPPPPPPPGMCRSHTPQADLPWPEPAHLRTGALGPPEPTRPPERQDRRAGGPMPREQPPADVRGQRV